MRTTRKLNKYFFYVYRLARLDGTQIYIGCRMSKLPPQKDFGQEYFSSGVLEESFRETPADFTWEILSEHANHDEALAAEDVLIKEIWYNPDGSENPACVNGFQHPLRFRRGAAWLDAMKKGTKKSASSPEGKAQRRRESGKWASSPEGKAQLTTAGKKGNDSPQMKHWQRGGGLRDYCHTPKGNAQRVAAGKKGAEARWGKKDADSTVAPTLFEESV